MSTLTKNDAIYACKANLLRFGFLELHAQKNKDNPDAWRSTPYEMEAEFAVIIANLTDPDKQLRETAKKRVRELVKLGDETTKC